MIEVEPISKAWLGRLGELLLGRGDYILAPVECGRTRSQIGGRATLTAEPWPKQGAGSLLKVLDERLEHRPGIGPGGGFLVLSRN
jgi:hypothetical protein